MSVCWFVKALLCMQVARMVAGDLRGAQDEGRELAMAMLTSLICHSMRTSKRDILNSKRLLMRRSVRRLPLETSVVPQDKARELARSLLTSLTSHSTRKAEGHTLPSLDSWMRWSACRLHVWLLEISAVLRTKLGTWQGLCSRAANSADTTSQGPRVDRLRNLSTL